MCARIMFEFEDELIIDTYRIPWLIWIQLIAMFLLVILLYYFTTTTTPSDLSLHFSTASDSPSATGLPFVNHSIITSAAANARHNSKVRENEIKETGTSTSEGVPRAKKPDVRPRAGTSTTNDGRGMMFEQSHHPCHFFGIAKHAFLKCLGIDSAREKED